MQARDKLALTKNYVLLVNETPVNLVLPDLLAEGILNPEMAEYINSKVTGKDKARALLEILPRRGPIAFQVFCRALLARHRYDLVSAMTDPDQEDMDICFPQVSNFCLGGDAWVIAEGYVVQLVKGPVALNFPLVRWRMLEDYLGDISSEIEQVRNNRWVNMEEHLGGNVFVSVNNHNGDYVDIRQYFLSPSDNKKHPTRRESHVCSV